MHSFRRSRSSGLPRSTRPARSTSCCTRRSPPPPTTSRSGPRTCRRPWKCLLHAVAERVHEVLVQGIDRRRLHRVRAHVDDVGAAVGRERIARRASRARRRASPAPPGAAAAIPRPVVRARRCCAGDVGPVPAAQRPRAFDRAATPSGPPQVGVPDADARVDDSDDCAVPDSAVGRRLRGTDLTEVPLPREQRVVRGSRVAKTSFGARRPLTGAPPPHGRDRGDDERVEDGQPSPATKVATLRYSFPRT